MRAWQTPTLEYYLADERRSPGDTLAPDRPSADYEWQNGAGWVLTADYADRRALRALDRVLDRVSFEVLLNHENRIRVLESRPQLDRVQFRTLLVILIRNLFT